MNTDPISDLLTRIRNADRASKSTISVPYSTIKENICKVMKDNKFIGDYKKSTKNKFPELNISLADLNYPLTLKRVSKPGQRIYKKNKLIKPVLNRLGILIISTPKGIMSDNEARKQNLGGEIICEVY